LVVSAILLGHFGLRFNEVIRVLVQIDNVCVQLYPCVFCILWLRVMLLHVVQLFARTLDFIFLLLCFAREFRFWA
jgi:hypothetical protein